MMLLALAVAWALGIALAKAWGAAPPLWAGLSAVVMLVGLALWRWRQKGLFLALSLMLVLGGWRYLLSQPRFAETSLAYYNDRGWVEIEGYISAEPNLRATYTQLELSAERILWEGTWRPVQGKVLLNVPLYPARTYGERLRVSGLLETPPVLEDFNYREYLASRGVYSLLRRPRVVPLGGTRGNPFLRHIFAWKHRLRQAIEAVLPYPEAGLLSGILLGLSHTLPGYLAQAFKATGLTHIIVISGFNISIVAQAVILASNRLFHRWLALGLSLLAVGLYTLFVGPSPPVLRAALMGGLFLGAQLLGRRSHPLASLAAASLAMTAANPLLLWSVSFQLSFVATLALILLEPLLARGVASWLLSQPGGGRAGRWFALVREFLTVTVAAQLLTLPLIWHHFGQISLLALLANVLVLPIQPAIMFLGFVATVAGLLWPAAGQLCAWAVWPLLRYNIRIVEVLGTLPWAALQLPRLPALGVWIFYAFLGLGWMLLRSPRWRVRAGELLAQPKGRLLSLALPGLVAILVWSAVFSLPDGRLHVYFMDVGQGDAILLRAPNGQTVLVDGGPDPLTLRSRLGEILPFWQRHLDILVATHADQDHLLGLLPLLGRYRVGYALGPPSLKEGGGTLGAQWRALLEEARVRRIVATQGMRLRLGERVQVEVLHPRREDPLALEDENYGSLVLMVHMGRCRILLTADIDQAAEAALLGQGVPLEATVLKVAHHGAETSSSWPFLQAVDPRVAIISVGEDNPFGHPAEKVLQRLKALGCRILRTDEQGTIELITDGRRYWLRMR
ncbi:MAG: DNA internalization-related competence protein ComEC/Rec2 [Anaerolineae bacterium]|nr:DNA internalization-related competence protein ComEC/Rec2 [Anaerolineae bacterium]